MQVVTGLQVQGGVLIPIYAELSLSNGSLRLTPTQGSSLDDQQTLKQGAGVVASIALLNNSGGVTPVTITNVVGLYRVSALAVSISNAGIDDSSLTVGTTADSSGTAQAQTIGPYSNSVIGTGGEFVALFSVGTGGSLYYSGPGGTGATSNIYITVEKLF